jgi:hypothetical protein
MRLLLLVCRVIDGRRKEPARPFCNGGPIPATEWSRIEQKDDNEREIIMQTNVIGQNSISAFRSSASRRFRRVALTFLALSFFQLAGVGAQSRAQSVETIVTGQTALVGLGRAEMMRFTAFNPEMTDSGEPNEPISLRLKLFDAHGNVIAESRAVQIPPGEFRSVDFNHDELPIAGEPGTTRKQIRTQPLWGLRHRPLIHVPTSLEIIDSTTGTGSFKFFFKLESLP